MTSHSREYEGFLRPVSAESSSFWLHHNLPSTAHKPVSAAYLLFTFVREDTTSSRTLVVDDSSDPLEEARAQSGVNSADANANVFEIRRLTGLGWGQLATILGVDRRTVHNWVKGRDVRDRNRKRIADTLAVLQHIDRGSAQETLLLLQEPTPRGPIILDLLKQKEYEKILRVVAPLAAARPAPTKAERTGEYKAITIHPDAAGSETHESLRFEPQPPARKRVRRRA